MARVKVSSSTYGRPIHKFHWVIDKETMVEHIKPTAELDVALPPPTKLNTTPFDQLRRMTPSPGVEIDFIGVILACGPSKYTGRTQTRCREVTLTDDRENQLLLTLWDDFYDIEGSKLESKVKGTNKLPVLLGRNIGVSPYQGLTLQTRFNSTICLNPPYPQALELLDWAQANQQRLSARSLPHGPTSATAVATPPDGHSVITIAQLTAEAVKWVPPNGGPTCQNFQTWQLLNLISKLAANLLPKVANGWWKVGHQPFAFCQKR